MTKYQLVYIKLETNLHKILSTANARKVLRLKKAFAKFRQNTKTTIV